MSGPVGKIEVGGQDLEVYRWTGKQGRKRTARVLPLLAQLENANMQNLSLAAASELINTFWGNDEFEDDLVPYAFFVAGRKNKEIPTPEEQEWLDDLDLPQVFKAFVQIVGMTNRSADSEEVEAAQKK